MVLHLTAYPVCPLLARLIVVLLIEHIDRLLLRCKRAEVLTLARCSRAALEYIEVSKCTGLNSLTRRLRDEHIYAPYSNRGCFDTLNILTATHQDNMTSSNNTMACARIPSE